MSNAISWFVKPHMALLLVLVLVVAAGATWLFRHRIEGRPRTLTFCALVASIGIVFLVTLVREGSPSGVCLECVTRWSIGRAVSGAIGTEVLLNVALFAPLGFLATLLWRRPFLVTAIAALLSVGVELLQALIGVGVSDLLDVVANTAGAFVGSWLAWLLCVARDAMATRRVDPRELTKLVAVLLASVAVCWGGSAWVATMRQAAIAGALEEHFAGTTLVDYERWEADDQLDERVFSKGTPWASDAFRDDAAARVRFPASFYFAERCVVGTWEPGDFSTSLVSGRDCTETPVR